MAGPPDVLFLVLDSLRTDRASAYGHDRPTTPTLERLADDATRYTNAYTAAPWTLPSHCSMFTGLFPTEHGITNAFADASPRLQPSTTTLAEGLATRGYATAGYSNNPWVGSLSGLDRGFEEFVEWDLRIGRSTSDVSIHTRSDRALSRVHTLLGQAARQPVFLLKRPFFTRRLVGRAVRWVTRAADSDAPTFTFLNLMEAHSPYFPPDDAFRGLDLRGPSVLEPRVLNTKLLAYILGRRSLTREERDRVRAYYDASVRFQDGQVRRILEALDRVGSLDDTLVVVCSDHGKTLGEYDRGGTPPHYAREINVNVPLLVKEPGQREGSVVDVPVELPALYRLVLQASDPDASSDQLARRREESSTGPPVAFVEDYLPHTGRSRPERITRWRMVVGREYKLLTNDTGDEYFFDVSDSRDRLVDAPDERILDVYRDALDRRSGQMARAERDDVEDDDLDRTVKSQLHDLGYL